MIFIESISDCAYMSASNEEYYKIMNNIVESCCAELSHEDIKRMRHSIIGGWCLDESIIENILNILTGIPHVVINQDMSQIGFENGWKSYIEKNYGVAIYIP